MKGKVFIAGLMILISLSLFSCGGGTAGAPGTSGSEDTGILITAVSITSETPDLDTNTHLCPPDFTTSESPAIHRDDAVLTIDTAKLNANLISDPFPASVEQCTITYLKAVEDPSSPIIPSLTIFPNCTLIDGTNTCNVTLIDIQRKLNYWIAINNGLNLPSEYPTHYVAQLNCRYMGNFGKSGGFKVEFDIWLADFDHC